MPPASYMQAAEAVYQPQEQAEATSLQATDTTTKNTLQAEVPQIQTDYQSAIDKLTLSVQNQTASINQLYSQRLGGNFSGLQGNDLGSMYAQANEQQSIISQTEANKLSEITTEEGNADITYQADLSALTPKYQSLEESAAETSYAADQKAAQDQSNSDRTYDLDVAKFEQSASNSDTSAANTLADKYKVSSLSSGNKAYTGPNGETNLYQYAQGVNGGSTADPDAVLQTIQQELSTGSTTDKGAAAGITKLQNEGKSTADIIASLQKSNAYIFE